MTRTSLKFLHLADLHLGSQFFGGRLKLPYDKAEKRVREQHDALSRAVELAHDEDVEIIFIAGDLWEEDGLTADTVAFVLDTLAKAAVPVVIAPGNHDYYAPGSHYSDEITRSVIGRTWPDNVIIVRDYDFTHFRPPRLDGVSVTGIAYHSNQPVKLRRFSKPVGSREADLSICVVHGSRDDHLPPGKLRTMPFSDSELLTQPFDYMALGHYHTSAQIMGTEDLVRAAYPGSAFALSADETGPHGCLIGTVRQGGVEQSSMEFHELDQRRIHRLKLNISGLQYIQAVEKKIAESLADAEVQSQDMVLVELEGTYPQPNRMVFSEDFLMNACFHLTIETSGVKPEWDIDDEDKLEKRTTEGLFRMRLREMIERAEEQDDRAEVIRLQNVLYYGLDALHARQIIPRQIHSEI